MKDVYHHLMFMCAPYLTIQNLQCKYKVKLTPGTQKKGKGKKKYTLRPEEIGMESF